MAGCFVLAVLGYRCERGTKTSTVHLWLDVWHLSHVLDALPWVQELLRQESSGIVWGKVSFSLP